MIVTEQKNWMDLVIQVNDDRASLADELSAAIDDLKGKLDLCTQAYAKLMGVEPEAPQAPVRKKRVAKKKAVKRKAKPKEAAPEPEPAPPAKPNGESVDIDTVREALSQVVKKGVASADEVRAIIKKQGAPSVPTLSEMGRKAVYAWASELLGDS